MSVEPGGRGGGRGGCGGALGAAAAGTEMRICWPGRTFGGTRTLIVRPSGARTWRMALGAVPAGIWTIMVPPDGAAGVDRGGGAGGGAGASCCHGVGCDVV